MVAVLASDVSYLSGTTTISNTFVPGPVMSSGGRRCWGVGWPFPLRSAGYYFAAGEGGCTQFNKCAHARSLSTSLFYEHLPTPTPTPTTRPVVPLPFVVVNKLLLSVASKRKRQLSTALERTLTMAPSIKHRLAYSCLSTLYLLRDASAFLSPARQSRAIIPSSRRTSLLSTTEEAAASIINESYVAPLDEIERRRNLAIISHPDSGMQEFTVLCHIILFLFRRPLSLHLFSKCFLYYFFR